MSVERRNWLIVALVLVGLAVVMGIGGLFSDEEDESTPVPTTILAEVTATPRPTRMPEPTWTPYVPGTISTAVVRRGTPTPTPTVTPESKVDESGFSDLQVWRFCTSSFQGETTPEQLSLVVRLDEDALIKENAKRVHRLVIAMYKAHPRVDVGLMRQTLEACEKWRDDDWAESQSK